jgi:CRP-like cAMP-binding protein
VTPRQKATLDTLERGEWFGGLPQPLRWAIVERARTRRYPRGSRVREEGQPPAALFAVLAGEVAAGRWTRDGELSLLHVGGPGFWFGEVPLLLRCEQIATVVARTDVVTLELSIAAFDQLVGERPELYPHFARLAVERYAVMLRQVSELLALDKEALLRARLADLIDLRRLEDPTRADVISVPQAELAALTGMSRQTLSDLLKRLEKRGWLELSYRAVRVRDPKALRGDRPRTDFFRGLSEFR